MKHTDAQIWADLQRHLMALEPINAIPVCADFLQVPLDRVQQVYRERTFSAGAG